MLKLKRPNPISPICYICIARLALKLKPDICFDCPRAIDVPMFDPSIFQMGKEN